MSTKQAGDRRTEQKSQKVGLLEAVVRDNVLFDLGKPPGQHRVQVKCVYGASYRVNVFIGPDISSFKLAHSYILTVQRYGGRFEDRRWLSDFGELLRRLLRCRRPWRDSRADLFRRWW
jgi:hypothetical protein